MRVSTRSARAVATRLSPLLQLVMEALREGIAVSAGIHTAQGWNPGADRHTSHGLVRREAMERLKPFGARLEDGDNLGLPMSGLILRSDSGDVLRVWYSEDGELPPMTTRPLRRFCQQHPTDQGALFVVGPYDWVTPDGAEAGDTDRADTDRGDTDRGDTDRGGTDRGDTDRGSTDGGGTSGGGTGHPGGTDGGRQGVEPSNLAVLWNDDGGDLIRFDLVRPHAVEGRRAVVDWHLNLLGRLDRADDLDFGDGDRGSLGELG
jgi:hypothetical protein